MNTSDKRELICISCPLGCQLSVDVSDGKPVSVSGNQCKRGIVYAESEILNPRRILTTTIRIKGGVVSQLPVRTKEPISKDLMMQAIRELRKYEVNAPVELGEVIVSDLLGTGVDVIASRTVVKAE